jgi:4-amino-4-deoxy-L-arabinose transferase-like glycosyltransferase
MTAIAKKSAAPSSALSVILFLLLYMFTRLHNLSALPLFIDEAVYIRRSQLVRDGQILLPAGHSRILHAWLTAILGPDAPGGAWLARVAIVILGLLGAAALYAVVRSWISHRAGLVAFALWTATPYGLFYERMSLGDSALAALAVVCVWMAWQLARKGQWRMAVALGVGLVAVMLAKASGTAWLPLPAVALILVGKVPWRQRILLGALAYGTFAALWGPFMLVLRWRGYEYFSTAERFVSGVDQNIIERIWHNISDVWGFDLAYVGLPVLIIAVLGTLYWLWLRPLPALYGIAALGMGGGGAIVFGHSLNSRYAFNHAVWVVLLCAVGLGLLIERHPRWRHVSYAALAVWAAVFFMPFAYNAWYYPGDLPLKGNDLNEYIRQEPSGFGITGIGQRLGAENDRLPVLGLVANCEALRMSAYPARVECPRFDWFGTNENLLDRAEQMAAEGPLYVVGESLAYLDLSGLPRPHTLVTTVERPDSAYPVHLYRIDQGARRP